STARRCIRADGIVAPAAASRAGTGAGLRPRANVRATFGMGEHIAGRCYSCAPNRPSGGSVTTPSTRAASADLPEPTADVRGLFVPFLCFFLSGASGLVFEVIWTRKLALVFGASTPAISTVLSAFM